MPSHPNTTRPAHLCAHCIRYGPQGQNRCPCSVELTGPMPRVATNMWVQGHGPAAIPPPPYAVPVPYPEAAAPVQKRPGNPAAIAAVVCAVLGLLLSGVPLLRAVLGVVAVACGILGNAEAVKHDARRGKLALLGALLGVLEVVALFAG